MKCFLVSIFIGLAGCQSTPAPSVLPAPTKPVVNLPPAPTVAVVVPASATVGLEQKLRQQSHYIEALISQNDALTAKITTTRSSAPPPPTVVPLPPDPAPLPRPAPLSPMLPPEPTLTPNADNVIDLVAFVVSEKPGEPVNPFTVRTVPPEAMREVTLHVGGIVAGPMACAVINDRLVQVGEIIESLVVERIEADAVLLRHSGRLLRLPVAEKSTRVRLPL